MRVGVGILSYNRPGSLEQCLRSLFENLDRSAKVAVSFDLWNPEFQSIAERYPIWAVTGSQRGISCANNRLLKLFEGHDAIFLVQDDVRFLRPEWLECYLRGLNVVPYLAFFDPYYPQDPDRPRHFKPNYFKRRRLVTREGVRLWLCHKSPQGAFQAISRTCLEQVGHFDTRFGVYGIEHHDYWLRTCTAGFAPPEHFYDVEQGVELLKVDWNQPPSLTEEEREAASRQSKSWRRRLFGPEGTGFQRIKVLDHDTDVRILRQGPDYQFTPLPAQGASDLLAKACWVYPTRIPVLSYHAVDDAPGDRYAVSPAQFKLQIEGLAGHFQFVTAAQAFAIWRENRHFPKDLAILTFDDGYQDFLSITPLLAELNIKATVFVPVRWVGQDNTWDRGAFTTRRHLDWEQLETIAAMGHEVGSHGVDHCRLTKLPLDQARREIIESRNVLMNRLNQPVGSIAYPFGSVNAELIKIAQPHYNAGFVGGQGGVLDWHERPCAMRRIVVSAGEDALGLLSRIASYMMVAPDSEPVWYPKRTQPKRPDEG